MLLPSGPLNPFGIVFLAVSGGFWFGWEMIEDVYADEAERRRAGCKIPDPLFGRFAPRHDALPRCHRPPKAGQWRRLGPLG